MLRYYGCLYVKIGTFLMKTGYDRLFETFLYRREGIGGVLILLFNFSFEKITKKLIKDVEIS
jgi:hypothetical protein